MQRLIKTQTGKKLHVATGTYIHCGFYPSFWPEITTITGVVEKSSICANCTKGMDVTQFGIEGVTFNSGGKK